MKTTDETKANPGYEPTDADPRTILYIVSTLGILIVFMMALMAGLYYFLDGKRVDRTQLRPNLTDSGQLPPLPRLQIDPSIELKDIRDWEEEQLTDYGWVDKDTGVFRIPIERAIEITAQMGLPARQLASEEENP